MPTRSCLWSCGLIPTLAYHIHTIHTQENPLTVLNIRSNSITLHLTQEIQLIRSILNFFFILRSIYASTAVGFAHFNGMADRIPISGILTAVLWDLPISTAVRHVGLLFMPGSCGHVRHSTSGIMNDIQPTAAHPINTIPIRSIDTQESGSKI